MGHTEIVDGRSIKVEEVNIVDKDINKIYKEFGLKTSVQPRYRPVKRRSKAPEPYVRTIPLSWIQQASRLPGKALHVGIALWHLVGVSKSRTVTLTRSRLSQFGLHHETARRGLLALEKAGLVRVERSGNKSPRITPVKVTKTKG